MKLAARSMLLSTTLGLLLALVSRGTTAETTLVSGALMQSAMAQGSVRVIVQLGGTGAVAESSLPDTSAVVAQRQAIALAQTTVRGGLKGTSHRIVRQFRTMPYMAIEASPGALHALDSMRGVGVVGVHEDMVLEPTLHQSVPLIQALQAAMAGFDGAGMVVAILDTGVQRDHRFLGGKVVDEACFSSGISGPDGVGDCPRGAETQLGAGAAAPCRFVVSVPNSGIFNPCDHGTHVAGIAIGVGGDPASALPRTGVAPGGQIMAVQVFSNSHDATNRPIAFTSDIVAGLEHVLAKSQAGDGAFTVAAVNMSLGGSAGFSTPASCDVVAGGAMKLAIDNLRAAGIATVVSAGNNGFRTQIVFPACTSSAVAVASTGDGGPELPSPVLNRVSSFSNVASTTSFPSLLAAPGQWITSSVPTTDGISDFLPSIDGFGYATIAGTSMAAPHVAGAFAILKQMAPAASVNALLHALQSTGVTISDARSGAVGAAALPRRLDVLAALESLGPDPTVTAATITTVGGVPPGGNVSVSYTLKNLGGLAASSVNLRFGLSSIGGGDDIPIGPSRTVALLDTHASQTFTNVALIVPPTTPIGSYYVRVTIDPDHLLGESNPNNNWRLTTNYVPIFPPDLTVPSVTFTPAATGSGQSITVAHTLRNIEPSPANAPASVSAIYLGTNSSFISVVGGALGTVNMPAVNPGATSASVTKAVPIPSGLIPSRYFVFVRANDKGAFVETSTANNVGSSTTSIIVGPDLTVTTATTAAGAVPGANVSVTYVVKNLGGAPSDPSHVGLILVPVSPAGAPTGSGVSLSVTPSVPSLPAGGSTPARTVSVPIPADTTPGSYRIRVVSDGLHEIADADRSNDALMTTGLLGVVQPDLTVSSVTFTPAVSKANGSVTVTHVVKNLATAPANAGASQSHLYLTSSNSSAASPIGNFGLVPVGPVAALAGVTITRTVTIPPTVAPGFYYLLANADDMDAVVESNEGNNLGASATRILIGPDLTVSAAATGTGVAPGANVSVTYTLANKGGDAASSFNVGFALAPVLPTGVSSGDDIPIGPTRVGVSLAAGASLASTSVVTIPPDTAPGFYKIRVLADASHAVPEADETNNERLTGVFVVARPDLTVPSVTFSPIAIPVGTATNVNVTHVVKNLAGTPGNAPASQSALALLSTSTSVVADLGPVAVPAIRAAATATVARTVTIPATVPVGLYAFSATADAPNAIAESNELNNVGSSSVRLIVGPDILFTAAATGTTVAPGKNASVTFTVKNQGGSPTGSFDVGFALVPVNAAGAPTGSGDIPIGPPRSGVMLAPGASQSLTSNALIPGDVTGGVPAGIYRIKLIADPGNAVSEADETNNTRLTGVLSVVRPNLTVSSVTFTPAAIDSAPPAAGRNVSVTHVVHNIASVPGSAPASQSLIVLSSDQTIAGQVPGVPAVTVNIGAIAANGSQTLTTPFNVPSGTPAGTYFFVVRADSAEAILEINENNNVRASVTPLILGADLVVPTATTPATSMLPGSNVSVSYTVKNQGGAAASPSFAIGFHLVPRTDTSGSADIPLSVSRIVQPLAAGVTSPVLTNSIPLPGDLPAGSYLIRVTGNADGAVTEADLTNNTRLTNPFNLVPPDLTAASVTFTPARVSSNSRGISRDRESRLGSAGP
jgi:subtilase family serine protease